MKNISFIIGIFIFSIKLILGFEITHPVQVIPKDKSLDPVESEDIFSANLIIQIHSPLFAISNKNIPIPILLKDFKVSKNQKKYTFYLSDLTFKNGLPLTSRIVKSSLEHAISRRIPGYEKLSIIRGVELFLKGLQKNISGIRVIDNQSFEIILTKPFPRLIYNLSDYRLSIVLRDGQQIYGLGKYYISKKTQNKIILNSKDKSENLVSRITFSKASKLDAINGFNSNIYNDLFMYYITSSEINNITKNAKIHFINTAKTYIIYLNPFRFRDLKARKSLVSFINRYELVSNCYPGNIITDNIIPHGILGHFGNKKIISKDLGTYDSKNGIRILIHKGSGQEECVKSYFEGIFRKNNIKIETKILDVEDALQEWYNNNAELMFGYLEVEENLDVLQFFHPNIKNTVGDPFNKKTIEKYKLLNNALSYSEYAQHMFELHEDIVLQYTALPLFHPKQPLIYSKDWKIINTGVKSPTFIKFADIRLEKKYE
ncbi:MAG: ABC transporter substrate-binding protein [Pseudomonadota bacterium]